MIIYCGAREQMGQGVMVICGNEFYHEIYQCHACKRASAILDASANQGDRESEKYNKAVAHMERIIEELRSELDKSQANYKHCAQVMHNWCARYNEIKPDHDRLNKLDSLCESYGFQGAHEGNRWAIEGPYKDIRQAIDGIKEKP